MKSSKKSRQIQHDVELVKDVDQSSLQLVTDVDEYKSPFTREYDQAISLQANSNNNEWNLKDFYRDVKTSFEPETNTKDVFEKCLKLAR